MIRRVTLIFALILLNTACQQDNSISAACTDAENLENGVSESSTDPSHPSGELDLPNLLNRKTTNWMITYKSKIYASNPDSYFVEQMNQNGSVVDANTVSVSVNDIQNRSKLVEDLLKDPRVARIQPDYMLETMDTIDMSAIKPTQWPHQKIKTTQAWSYTQGRPEVVVAVIDSGVDFSHPDLRNSKWVNPRETANGRDDDGNGLVDDIHGWDYVKKRGNPSPTSKTRSAYHGTHVAGIIAGAENYSKGYVGVSPNVKIMGLRFLDDNKTGLTSNGIKAINYAIDKGVKIINLSWGSYNKNTQLMNAIKRAQDRGVLIVAAAGNFGKNNNTSPFYPASYPYSNIISVTASGKNDALVKGINYGTKTVHMAAPGLSILSTDMNGSYVSRTGSSMAAPFVAGAAALLLSADPKLKAPELKNLLLNRADKISSLKSRVASGRRVNVGASMKALAAGSYSSKPVGATPEEICL